jgi:hypothetical protein
VKLLESGEHEGLKTTVHAALSALVLACAAYNASAWRQRREPHLAFNAVAYTILTVWELTHVWHHLQKEDRDDL